MCFIMGCPEQSLLMGPQQWTDGSVQSPGCCFFSAHFQAEFQRVPGQDDPLGNRLGFNVDRRQNRPTVTCSGSREGLEKPEGGGMFHGVLTTEKLAGGDLVLVQLTFL